MPYRLLFPLAALFAFIAVPLWLVLRVRHPAITGTAWHGHEMVFGFALTVIAGFLATRPARATTWILAGTWLAARIAAATGSGPLAFITGVLFPVTVFGLTVPPLLAGAKRRENRILPVLLAALVAADVAWWSGAVWFGPQVQARALLVAIDLLALLLLLIGGRALRAAAGGHLERNGIARRDHLQRRYEFPLAVLVGSAVVFDVFALETVAGTLCIGAAFLALVRVLPWQLHHTLSHPHLWTLALGYLWLVPGLAFKGIAQLAGNPTVTGMLHGIAVGALGTLTLVMMARTVTLRARKPLVNFSDVGIAALLLSAAALVRLVAGLLPSTQHWLLWIAAAAWSSAFLILLTRLWRAALPVGKTAPASGRR
jgi:uncharacterized protein involved in response to NO